MSLILKYRPETLDDIYGNDSIIRDIKNIFTKPVDERPHAFLLTGYRGCGKTTIARIISKMTDCNIEHDFIEIDVGEYRGIDAARTIKKNIQYRPLSGPARVYLLDECHRLTPDAQEALLKTTEEPPSHAYIIYSTTDPEKLKATLKDRCTVFQVEPLEEKKCIKFLRVIARREGIKIPIPIIELIVEKSDGRPRSALKLLEKVIGIPESEMEAKLEEDKKVEYNVIDLCRALINPDGSWKSVANILNKLKSEDPEAVRRMVLGYCCSIMLKKRNDVVYIVAEAFRRPFYDNGKQDLICSAYEAMNDIDLHTGKNRR